MTASNSLTLNDDGTLTTDLVGLGIQTWQQDQGFLVMTTDTGNLFFRPRLLATDTVLLVQTDVLARNGVIINITARPKGNLLLIRA